MKFRAKNILGFFIKLLLPLVICFLIDKVTMAQSGDESDTNAVHGGDSTGAGQQTESGTGRSQYFEYKTDVPVTDAIELREVPASVIDSLKKDDEFWYADKVFKNKDVVEKKTKARNIKSPSQWMSMTMLVIIVVIFLVVLTWYLLQNSIITRRKPVSGSKGNEIPDENIFAIEYQKEIEKAISSANYRLAIRLMFLRSLRDLSEKNIIQFKQERTNFDYLSQLSSGRYYNDFFRLTRNYECAWYGKFYVSPEAFELIKSDFEKFNSKLF